MEEVEHNTAVCIYDGETKSEKLKTPMGKEFNLLNLNLGLTAKINIYSSGPNDKV